jgi:hypothetical protein
MVGCSARLWASLVELPWDVEWRSNQVGGNSPFEHTPSGPPTRQTRRHLAGGGKPPNATLLQLHKSKPLKHEREVVNHHELLSKESLRQAPLGRTSQSRIVSSGP